MFRVISTLYSAVGICPPRENWQQIINNAHTPHHIADNYFHNIYHDTLWACREMSEKYFDDLVQDCSNSSANAL